MIIIFIIMNLLSTSISASCIFLDDSLKVNKNYMPLLNKDSKINGKQTKIDYPIKLVMYKEDNVPQIQRFKNFKNIFKRGILEGSFNTYNYKIKKFKGIKSLLTNEKNDNKQSAGDIILGVAILVITVTGVVLLAFTIPEL